MSWLAILLSLAALGGNPAPGARPTLKQCNQITNATAKKQCKKAAKAKPKKKSKATPKAPGKPTTGKQQAPKDGAPATSPTNRTDSEPNAGANPQGSPTPTPAPSPGPTPAPTPSPVYPSRTGVDLVDGEEWTVRPSYRILAAGRIDFVATNVGEDDHDLSVRQGTTIFGKLPVAPGESDTLTLTLAAGTYTLFCSLPDHEDAGMRANISVR